MFFPLLLLNFSNTHKLLNKKAKPARYGNYKMQKRRGMGKRGLKKRFIQ